MSENTALPEGAIQIPEGAPVTTLRPPNMPTMYVNNIGFGVGPIEVRLFLGEIVPNQEGTGVVLTQRLAVVMTPEYAKVMAETLLQAIANLEQQYGTLRNVRPGHQPTEKST
jgi:hypothetical protein